MTELSTMEITATLFAWRWEPQGGRLCREAMTDVRDQSPTEPRTSPPATTATAATRAVAVGDAAAEQFDQARDAVTSSVPHLRRHLSAWLAVHGVPAAVATELALVASELCTNAVEAARSTVELRAWLERDYVVLEARDDGPGFTGQLPERGDRADPDVDRGRGLFVVSALVDVLWATTDESMTTVRCARRLTW